jgi:subtilisin family serine protease
MRQIIDLVIYLLACYLVGLIVGLCVGFAVLSATVHADELHQPKYKIAIIDTGYDMSLVPAGQPRLKLCRYGHFDFTTGKNAVGSSHPHGTHVASIIAKELRDVDYCAVIYNVYVDRHLDRMPNEFVVGAFYKASYESVIAINASYRGTILSVAEREAVSDAAKRVDRIFVAAGNDALNLDESCLAFPACFDIPNMFPVGAMKPDMSKRLPSSNYGSRIKLWFNGVFDKRDQGTSYAAPRALASYVLSLVQKDAPTTTKKQSEKQHTQATSTQD